VAAAAVAPDAVCADEDFRFFLIELVSDDCNRATLSDALARRLVLLPEASPDFNASEKASILRLSSSDFPFLAILAGMLWRFLESSTFLA